ncbi:MAG: glycine--tRNA ligase subunit beta [Candidatus Latescibacteria bacterium]|nr:glycine--tRNA ligase subunit beta [bacterium]MBD3425100.1 glycine--tRNA ligase subunit beta [Candidatus Latescibacterota bacterium]
MKKEYLLEIGCENLPSGYLATGLRQLEENLRSGLRDERINYQELSVTGTPNRLVVHITGMDEKQETLTETITGPPLSMALDEDGNYNQAAQGFARSRGAEVDELIRVEKKKGEYIAVQKKTPGLDAGDLLAARLPEWITGINFPRDMRWDRSGLVFARPVRWILSLLSDGELKIRLGELESGSRTRLKPYFNEYTDVDGIEHYFELMKREHIILDHDRRAEAVREFVKKEASRLGGRVVADEELVDTVSNLLESPVPMAGSYGERFLKLPRQVIIAALKGHQKYFSVEDSSGNLLPNFIAFADGVSQNLEEIARGNERVLQARLYDAEFYYREDTSEPVSEMTKELENIVWMRGMGTLAAKSERIEELALWFNREYLSGEEKMEGILSRAALLAKADLASEMVKDGKEFTRLQGYIGREYAKKSGESVDVADAIFEHYLPRFAGDHLPDSEAGIIISLSDKLDNISGGFLIGLNPTGSQDPYALRRQALGILRIMIEKQIPVPLLSAIRKSLSLFKPDRISKDIKPAEDAALEIEEFFEQRLSGLLRGRGYGYDQDLVAAVLAGEWQTPASALKMTSELAGMRDDGELGGFITAMKRIANIIPGSGTGDSLEIDPSEALKVLAEEEISALPFNPELFEEGAERDLFNSSVSASSEIIRLIDQGKTHELFRLLNERIVGPVNSFFEEVMVNCEDPEARSNRQSFLMTLHLVFSSFCDYSLVQED